MLEWCLRALGAARGIGPIVVALPPDAPADPDVGRVALEYGAQIDPHALEGVRGVPGGASRSESVRAALELVETADVVVHDAARPLAQPELFDNVVADLHRENADAVVTAAPVTDTIKEVLRGREISRTLDRSALWAAQTPQAFRTEILRRAIEATQVLSQATDDAMLVERVRDRIHGKVLVHPAPAPNLKVDPAPAPNLKVTTSLDLRVAELLLTERNSMSFRAERSA